MSTPLLEAFLARLYTDAAFLERFLSDREEEARRGGLTDDERTSVVELDAETLHVAARSFARKRSSQRANRVPFWKRLFSAR
jgi:hypothetical protein